MQSAKTRLWLTLPALLFLSGCATSPDNGGKRESDLDVLMLGVETMLPPRDPAGPVKRAEDAENFEDAWNLLLDLEDVDYLHEQDKQRTVDFVTKAVERIKQSRRPCTFWDNLFNRRTCS